RGAYGSAEETVTVRQPVMVQATLPRVLGPGEELQVPVSVFVLDEAIRTVTLSTRVDAPLNIVGDDTVDIPFERTGDQLGFVRIKVGDRLGKTQLRFVTSAGNESAEQVIDIDVRAPNPVSRRVQSQVVEAGADWRVQIAPHGLPGTNQSTLEVSGVPPLNLS